MKTPHFAIIGAGTAGLATAILLAREGNHVTIFEQVDELSPVGAGLLLQPAGLAVFEHLGVLDKALTLGAKVTGLEGQLPDKRLLVNSSVHDKFHRTLILSGFCLLKIAKISLNSSFFPKPIKR